ncbi:MAG: fused MFS/spermidine synthase [bacterium]|jgi:spermidine synthase|nr:fused MFS/spermidine synthase [candidate division KSB1 bacterium]MDH7560541.1 fused MFS/spermidine synthase [bacterium]
MRFRLGFAVLVMGATATVAQVVAMRELVVVFYGNELLLGLLLTSWLLCTAAGSALAGRVGRRLTRASSAFALLQTIAALVLPATILGARASMMAWGKSQGQVVGLLPMLLTPPAVIGPVCFVLGFLYTLGCKAFAAHGLGDSVAIGRVYVLESIGATVGGIAASFLLIRYLHALEIAALLGSLNLVSAWLLCFWPKRKVRLPVGIVVVGGIVALAATATPLHRLGNSLFWHDYRLLHSENTPYANVAVVTADESVSFFENGLISFTYPDPEAAENLVQLALLQHPRPERVLLLGGGLGGGLQEVLKTPSVSHIDYVELDPRLITLAREYLPAEAVGVLDDLRVGVHHVDGRLYVQKATSRYDVVIIGLPEPRTTMVNRFFTREFFMRVRDVLNPGGVLSFAVSSSENVIGEELARFLSCLRNTLASVFPEVVLFPGATAHFFASTPPTKLTTDATLLLQRLRERGIATQFVREYYLPFRLATARVSYLNQVLEGHRNERLNTDFAPVAYYFDLILWSRQVSPVTARLFDAIAHAGSWAIWLPAAIVALFFAVAARMRWSLARVQRWAVGWAVLCAGFSGIALEVACMVAFQAIYGYVYYRVSLLVTAFMAGLAIGGMLGTRAVQRGSGVAARFKAVVATLVLLPLATLGVMYGLPKASTTHGSLTQFVLPLLLLATGALDGYQFPLANDLFAKAGTRVEHTAGTIYALDLLGASVGALLAAAIAIPVLGLPLTTVGLAFLNLSALVAAALCLNRR